MEARLHTPEPALVIEQQDDGGGTVVVAVVGDVDQVTRHQFAEAVDEAVDRARRVEIDLSEVSFMDSAGINALVRCHAAAERYGRSLAVLDPQPGVRRVLDICGLLDVLG